MKTRLLLLLSLAACGPSYEAELPDAVDSAESAAKTTLASLDQPDTVDVGSWNVEWYGATDHGPTDEARQQANVAAVLNGLDLDVVGLVEVVSETAFHELLAKLPGYDGLLATDPRVEGGASYYSANEQKVALVFKKRFTVESARLVATDAQWSFAGRPPLEVQLSFTERGHARTLVVVVLHMKAMANEDGWSRRTTASAALKSHLDAAWPTRWVLTVGDWNDDLDVSTYRRSVSPFKSFLDDAAAYRFTTDALTTAGTSTTVGFSSTIDHHLATHSLAARFVEGSARVLRPDAWVPSYGTSTSDHYPVLTRYDLR